MVMHKSVTLKKLVTEYQNLNDISSTHCRAKKIHILHIKRNVVKIYIFKNEISAPRHHHV